MEYYSSKRVSISFNKAIDKMTDELKKQDFGIVTTINIKEVLKKKINVDFRNYTIFRRL